MWLIDSILKINIKLTRDTKKLKIVNVENDERRIKFVEIELFEIKIIDKNVDSRSRKFKTKNWNRKHCDLKINDSIKNALFEFDYRDLKSKKKIVRETTISQLKRLITRRKNTLINN